MDTLPKRTSYMRTDTSRFPGDYPSERSVSTPLSKREREEDVDVLRTSMGSVQRGNSCRTL